MLGDLLSLIGVAGLPLSAKTRTQAACKIFHVISTSRQLITSPDVTRLMLSPHARRTWFIQRPRCVKTTRHTAGALKKKKSWSVCLTSSMSEFHVFDAAKVSGSHVMVKRRILETLL